MKANKKIFDDFKEITQVIGPWFRAQNDYLDYYVDQKSKPGHDIENGKFSWFAATTMEIGSDEQKDVMRENYGKYGKIERSVAKLDLFRTIRMMKILQQNKQTNFYVSPGDMEKVPIESVDQNIANYFL